MRSASRTAEFIGNIGPTIPGGEHEPNNTQNDAIANGWPAAVRSDGFFGRQMVLNDVMREHRPAKGTRSVLVAMGPGFCSEMLLLEW